jgi:hypothetical protein
MKLDKHLIGMLKHTCAVFILLTLAVNLQAQNDFEPHSGQEGKDVIWVPTPQTLVDKMLDIAQLKPTDYLMDLGSGDGRLVITAAKRGANALGIEYNQDMVDLSIKNAAKEGVSNRAKFRQADLFETDFSKATVITLFLLPELNLRLRPTLLDLKPGTRIVSNTFTMDNWEPDEKAVITEGCNSWCEALLWIIPAKVQGNWKFDQGELVLEQEFQMLSGRLKTSNNSANITEGRLKGNEISFTANGIKYTGTVSGNKMQGTYRLKGETRNWSATKQ